MRDLICPFSATMTKKEFGCVHAQAVIRRGGTEFTCLESAMHASCSEIHAKIKTSALDAMSLEDNLLNVPHSTLAKIQFGGLLGLQAGSGNHSGKIENIAALISLVTKQYNDLSEIPFEKINTVILDYKMQRRSRKKK